MDNKITQTTDRNANIDSWETNFAMRMTDAPSSTSFFTEMDLGILCVPIALTAIRLFSAPNTQKTKE